VIAYSRVRLDRELLLFARVLLVAAGELVLNVLEEVRHDSK
jgi:hypothetical protein